MFKKSCVMAASLLAMCATQALALEPVQSKYNVTLGGYVKLDYTYNSAAVGPFYPQGALPAKGSAANQREESNMTARQSRLWLKANGPTLLGAKTGALIEGDFFGYSSLSNEFGGVRMRLAYGTLDWENTQVLFGQFWDIFGLAAANTLDLRQGGPAGAPASPRVPQVRLTQKIHLNEDNYIKLVFGVQNPVQDNPTNVNVASPAASATNAPFVPSNNPSLGTGGSYGAMVNVAGQAAIVSKALGAAPGFWGLPMKPLEVGIFALGGNQKVVGKKSVDNYGIGAYAFVPILKSKDGKSREMTASFEGQMYMAAGMNVQSANIVQLATAPSVTQPYAPKEAGILANVVFYPTQDWGVTAGYGRRNIVHSADYAAGTERSQSLLFLNTAYDLNAAVRVAAEYEHGESKFLGVPTGATADSGMINTARLSVIYFF